VVQPKALRGRPFPSRGATPVPDDPAGGRGVQEDRHGAGL